jgi:hypothetical protein
MYIFSNGVHFTYEHTNCNTLCSSIFVSFEVVPKFVKSYLFDDFWFSHEWVIHNFCFYFLTKFIWLSFSWTTLAWIDMVVIQNLNFRILCLAIQNISVCQYEWVNAFVKINVQKKNGAFFSSVGSTLCVVAESMSNWLSNIFILKYSLFVCQTFFVAGRIKNSRFLENDDSFSMWKQKKYINDD